MSKTKPKHDPKALNLTVGPTDNTAQQVKAHAALQPTVNAATVIDAYQGNIMGKDVDLVAMVDKLQSTIKDVNSGDLSEVAPEKWSS
jgi:hypothetical protein